jgi:hypothetical protein
MDTAFLSVFPSVRLPLLPRLPYLDQCTELKLKSRDTQERLDSTSRDCLNLSM